jgi:hypothetical protein
VIFTFTGTYALATTTAGFQNDHRHIHGKIDGDGRLTDKEPPNLLSRLSKTFQFLAEALGVTLVLFK